MKITLYTLVACLTLDLERFYSLTIITPQLKIKYTHGMCKVYININENNANEHFIWDLQPKNIHYELNRRNKTRKQFGNVALF